MNDKVTKKEMIDYILSIETSAVSAADLKKKKVGEIKEIYDNLKSTYPDEGDNDNEGTEEEDCEEECSYKEHIRELIFNITLDTLMDKYNDFFRDTTGYKIDNEMEQAYPINGNWLNLCPNNLKLWGYWDMDRWENEKDKELAYHIKEKYGHNV